jgi:hypothetical protein
MCLIGFPPLCFSAHLLFSQKLAAGEVTLDSLDPDAAMAVQRYIASGAVPMAAGSSAGGYGARMAQAARGPSLLGTASGAAHSATGVAAGTGAAGGAGMRPTQQGQGMAGAYGYPSQMQQGMGGFGGYGGYGAMAQGGVNPQAMMQYQYQQQYYAAAVASMNAGGAAAGGAAAAAGMGAAGAPGASSTGGSRWGAGGSRFGPQPSVSQPQ